jgi:hypothetical protein
VEEAIEMVKPQGDGSDGLRGYAYARSGRPAEAEAIAARSQDFPQRQILAFAGLRDADRTLAALERLAALNDRRALTYSWRPELYFMRDDPRLIAFRQRFGVTSSASFPAAPREVRR